VDLEHVTVDRIGVLCEETLDVHAVERCPSVPSVHPIVRAHPDEEKRAKDTPYRVCEATQHPDPARDA